MDGPPRSSDRSSRSIWATRWWGVPLLLLALWQLAALSWGLYAYLTEPPDPPLPLDPPAFAGWFQAIRDDVPPDDRLEMALREIRDTVVVAPPPRPAASETNPVDDPADDEALPFAGHVPDPLAGLDPDALWRLYDREDDIRVRIDLLARLGSAYGRAGEGHAADTCRLAGVWMAHEHLQTAVEKRGGRRGGRKVRHPL